MNSVSKKLSIAFYWHLHQPSYQLDSSSDYLMPWVRLHSARDYMSMLLLCDKFKNLKLNYNIVPFLLDALIDYGEKGAYDIHSRLCSVPIEELNNDDKEFILNNFFNVEYSSMVFPYEEYEKLYQKRFSKEDIGINDFSNQEYSDILAWFNLVWLNSPYLKEYPQIQSLIKKGKNYTLEDRRCIISIYQTITKKVIPTFKDFLDKGKIEITTSPYYHSILPIMLNIDDSQKNLTVVDSTLSDLNMQEDAQKQVELAIARIEQLFGEKPKGMWPSELGVSAQTLDLFKKAGLKWTISDEGILSDSINFDFVRNYKGYLEDPYFLMKTYDYQTNDNNNINIIFRDSIIPNLINFEYSKHNPKTAANDLYDRIKVIQNKLQNSPDESHLLTIAMEGENCWENYENNGIEFLENIYSLIENDETLETVLISDYLEKEKKHKALKKISTGSWINKNFQLWIGEPVKNLAWTYLKNVKEDFENFKKNNPKHEKLASAWKEILICQCSDWFWWYGEPNDSGQDHIFDYLFREHLKNVYRYFDLQIPKYLDLPLISILSKPSRYPQKEISPKLDGEFASDEEWVNAGCVAIPDGPILQDKKLFEKICYGADKNNFYLRLYLNDNLEENYSTNPFLHQMYIYMRNADVNQVQSPIRLINKTENVSPIMCEKFHNELRISMMDKKLYPIRFTKAIHSGLWAMQDTKNVKVSFQNVIDMCILFDDLGIKSGEKLEFFFANTNFGIKDTFSPQDIMLNIQRP